MNRRIFNLSRRLWKDRSGVALLEFGMTLPILLLLSLTGAELTNYVITRMRVSQIALHLADNAARIGSGSQLQAKQITEADINDLLTGAGLQAGELDLYRNGRVIISSIEPSIVNPANSRIRWQRCRGSKTTRASTYPTAAQRAAGATNDNLPGMGPDGRQVTAPPYGVTMFVEVYYEYQPLVKTSLSPTRDMTEIASMMVRDRRDTVGGANGVYQVSGVTPSTC
ncbi:TadE/TadG family type IV pilus assembly protein [Sphingomonas turrisvirgatae]|uniref:TadE/TadG family type IV pilus assembly protein n=1 Tax=Sphingomonas turrisvirgatae TaxID=1888892 RepID=UPI0009A1CC8A|nr:hypothetical protein [Sphingomonas turrisvirgatae]